MKQRIFPLTMILISFLTFPMAVMAQNGFSESIRKQELIQVGEKSFVKRCSGCHGVSGDGNGPASVMLDPKPRDLTKAVFKFKSTAIGELPTDADLMRVLNRGIIGTSMPSFSLVSEMEKRAIIEYIKTLAPDVWKKQPVSPALYSLSRPDGLFTNKKNMIAASLRGRVWFQELGCVSCHGNLGEGDGPSSKTLKDSWGNSIKPANLTMPYVKRGANIDDIAKSISLGVDGTPMPAHGDILQSIEDKFPEIKNKSYIWDLSAFVFYLRGKAAGIYSDEIPDIPKTGIPADEVNAAIGKYLE